MTEQEVIVSRLVNRNVVAVRGRTSMRLEPELWDALAEICRREKLALGELIRRIEDRGHPGGRTSAVRVYIVQYFRRLGEGLGDGDGEAEPCPPFAAHM